MKTRPIALLPAILLSVAPCLPLRAEVIVNSPITLTRRVQVQPIRVKKTTGETATLFGTPAQEIYIKTQVNRIFAQVGIRIDWLPVNDYTNNFAYDGSPSNYYGGGTRPNGDLDVIIANAPVPPKNSDPLVINMFFVEIVPGFGIVAENIANGLANFDYNGIAIQIGNLLPTWEGGRDVAAHVISHEIAHNLGLLHATIANNLMYSGQATSARLITSQRTAIFTNNAGIDGYEFLRTLPPASNYDTWDVANAVPGGPGDDPDGDGLDNIIEFMFGLNPHAFSTLPQPVSGPDGLTWTLPKQAGAVADGIAYQVETTDTLSSWLPAGADSGRSVVLQNDSFALSVRLQPGASGRFMRMNVTIPPAVAGYSLTIVPPSGYQPPARPYSGDSLSADPPGD